MRKKELLTDGEKKKFQSGTTGLLALFCEVDSQKKSSCNVLHIWHTLIIHAL